MLHHMGRGQTAALAPLLALCAAFTLLVGMHSVVTPLFEAPDEVWHYAYVRWLAQGHGLPPLDEDLSGAHQEAAQPPLYYLAAAAINAPFDDRDLPEVMWHNPGFGYQARGTTPDNKNMLVHTSAESFPWRGAALAVHVTRMASWFFGLVTVIAAWALGYEVFQDTALATTVGALVAFHPQFIFMSSVVNNDSAAAALATLGLWVGVRALRQGLTWRRTVLAGSVAGLSVLTKTSVLPMLPVLGGCLTIAALRATDAGSHTKRPRRTISQLLTFSVIALMAGGWWYTRNTILYGDPLGLSAHTQTLWGRAEPVSLLALLPELPLLWRSFWGVYGWGHVVWPMSVYVWLTILTLPALTVALLHTGSVWAARLRSEHRLTDSVKAIVTSRGDAPPWLLPITLNIAWGGGILLALIHWMRGVEAPHGRLLFPAIGAGAVVLTMGIKWIGRRGPRLSRNYRALLLYSFVLPATLAPTMRILATFAPPKLTTPDAIATTCDQPQDLVYGDHITLLCLEPQMERVRHGDDTAIKACWSSSAPINHDYTVYLHLLGPDTERYAERHTYPGLGTYPTSLWEPDSAFCEVYRLRIEPWADAPVRSLVEIGLYDADTGARLPVTTAGGHEIPLPIAGHVDIVRIPYSAKWEPAPEALGRFGPEGSPTIALISNANRESAERGAEIDITLTWMAIRDPDENYVAFVHVWQPHDTAPLAQSDAQPKDGWYPTTAWRSGDSVTDTHTLSIPETATPGVYPLWAGLYRAEDGARLAAYGPEARYPNDLAPLGTLRIE